MEVVGGIFEDDTELNIALDALHDAGFNIYQTFGPEELYREPGVSDEMEDSTRNQGHTAEGTVGGITTNPEPENPEEVSAQTVTDDLIQLGLSPEIAERYLAGLHQNKRVLLVQTEMMTAEKAMEVLKQQGGQEVTRYHPEDAFPEELWRKDLRS